MLPCLIVYAHITIDPWYGDEDGFEEVYQLIAKGVGPLLDAVLAAAAPAKTASSSTSTAAVPAKTEAKAVAPTPGASL
jgi:hypothetical protein